MAKKNQSIRLTSQHKKSQGVVGIFEDEAKLHDLTVGKKRRIQVTSAKVNFAFGVDTGLMSY
jgi:type II restriction enzyme